MSTTIQRTTTKDIPPYPPVDCSQLGEDERGGRLLEGGKWTAMQTPKLGEFFPKRSSDHSIHSKAQSDTAVKQTPPLALPCGPGGAPLWAVPATEGAGLPEREREAVTERGRGQGRSPKHPPPGGD